MHRFVTEPAPKGEPHAEVPAFASRMLELAREMEAYVEQDLYDVDTKPGRRSYYEQLAFEARHERYLQLHSAAWRMLTVARQVHGYVEDLFEEPALRVIKGKGRER